MPQTFKKSDTLGGSISTSPLEIYILNTLNYQY